MDDDEAEDMGGQPFAFSSIGSSKPSALISSVALEPVRSPWYKQLGPEDEDDIDPAVMSAIRDRFPLSGPVVDLTGPDDEEPA